MVKLEDVNWVMWAGAGVVWAISALRTRRTERAQGAASRRVHVWLISAAFTLLLWPGASRGPLGLVLGQAPVLGLTLTCLGLLVAVWARWSLGQNWSSTITQKAEHELIERGPYAYVRHPIYSGLLVAMVGTALSLGEVRGVLAVALAVIAYQLKVRTEEAFLVTLFGPAYRAYQQRVGALVPLLRRAGAAR